MAIQRQPAMRRQTIQQIHSVRSGAWKIHDEDGGYYYLCKLGIWIEFQLREELAVDCPPSVRWTINHWTSHYDTPAVLEPCTTMQDGIWRLELEDILTAGWREGDIRVADTQQPLYNRWLLWGRNKRRMTCLPLGMATPQFEFALFLKQQGKVFWENNHGHNFRISPLELLNIR